MRLSRSPAGWRGSATCDTGATAPPLLRREHSSIPLHGPAEFVRRPHSTDTPPKRGRSRVVHPSLFGSFAVALQRAGDMFAPARTEAPGANLSVPLKAVRRAGRHNAGIVRMRQQKKLR